MNNRSIIMTAAVIFLSLTVIIFCLFLPKALAAKDDGTIFGNMSIRQPAEKLSEQIPDFEIPVAESLYTLKKYFVYEEIIKSGSYGYEGSSFSEMLGMVNELSEAGVIDGAPIRRLQSEYREEDDYIPITISRAGQHQISWPIEGYYAEGKEEYTNVFIERDPGTNLIATFSIDEAEMEIDLEKAVEAYIKYLGAEDIGDFEFSSKSPGKSELMTAYSPSQQLYISASYESNSGNCSNYHIQVQTLSENDYKKINR